MPAGQAAKVMHGLRINRLADLNQLVHKAHVPGAGGMRFAESDDIHRVGWRETGEKVREIGFQTALFSIFCSLGRGYPLLVALYDRLPDVISKGHAVQISETPDQIAASRSRI